MHGYHGNPYCDSHGCEVNFGNVRMYVTLYRISRIIFTLDFGHIVGIPFGTVNCAPLVADLVLFVYEKNFIIAISDDNEADFIYFKISRRSFEYWQF